MYKKVGLLVVVVVGWATQIHFFVVCSAFGEIPKKYSFLFGVFLFLEKLESKCEVRITVHLPNI
jgi:hypothetical protein